MKFFRIHFLQFVHQVWRDEHGTGVRWTSVEVRTRSQHDLIFPHHFLEPFLLNVPIDGIHYHDTSHFVNSASIVLLKLMLNTFAALLNRVEDGYHLFVLTPLNQFIDRFHVFGNG